MNAPLSKDLESSESSETDEHKSSGTDDRAETERFSFGTSEVVSKFGFLMFNVFKLLVSSRFTESKSDLPISSL